MEAVFGDSVGVGAGAGVSAVPVEGSGAVEAGEPLGTSTEMFVGGGASVLDACVLHDVRNPAGEATPLLVTCGSHDDATSDGGSIRLWCSSGGGGAEPMVCEASLASESGVATAVAGDIVADRHTVLYGGSDGSCALTALAVGADSVSLVPAWRFDKSPKPARAVGSGRGVMGAAMHRHSQQAAVVWEDATIAVLDAERGTPSWQHSVPHGCSVNAVTFQSKSSLFTGSSHPAGQLALWDLRAAAGEPVLVAKDQTAGASVFAVDIHPFHDTIAVSGSSAGVLSAWDLRSPGQWLSSNRAHAGSVWDVQFHPTQPALVYSAGDDGRLLQWDFRHDRAVKSSADAANPHQMYIPLHARGAVAATTAYHTLAVSADALNAVVVNYPESRGADGSRSSRVIAAGDMGSLVVADVPVKNELE